MRLRTVEYHVMDNGSIPNETEVSLEILLKKLSLDQ